MENSDQSPVRNMLLLFLMACAPAQSSKEAMKADHNSKLGTHIAVGLIISGSILPLAGL